MEDRDVSKCYFNAADIGTAFGLKRLAFNITDRKSAHKEGIHYQVFDVSRVANTKAGMATQEISETHYFTYLGLLKAIFSSRSEDAAPFLIWATKTLFAAHLGTPESKQLLAAALTGISPDGIKNLCSATSGIITCIYLIR